MWRWAVLLLAMFSMGVVALLVLIRIQKLSQPTPLALPAIRYTMMPLPPSATPLPTSGDQYSLARLVRGRVLDYDPKTKTLTVIREALTATGQAETYLIDLNLQGLQEVTCWIDPMQTNEGESVPISRAFFQLAADSKLYLEKGEKTVEMIAVLGYLAQQRPYVLALLETTSPTAAANLITQLVVANCP